MPDRIEADGWADPPLASRARDVTPPRSLTIVKVALAILTALGLTLAENGSRFGKHLTSRLRAHFGGIGSDFKRRLAELTGRMLPINTYCFVGG